MILYPKKVDMTHSCIFLLTGARRHLSAHRREGAGQGQLIQFGPVFVDRPGGVRGLGRDHRQTHQPHGGARQGRPGLQVGLLIQQSPRDSPNL